MAEPTKTASEHATEALVLAAQKGDHAAFSRLIADMLPLVRRQSAKYKSILLDSDDLLQEGLLGKRRFRLTRVSASIIGFARRFAKFPARNACPKTSLSRGRTTSARRPHLVLRKCRICGRNANKFSTQSRPAFPQRKKVCSSYSLAAFLIVKLQKRLVLRPNPLTMRFKGFGKS